MRLTILPGVGQMWIYRSAVSVFIAVSIAACQDSTSIRPAESDTTPESPAKPTVPNWQAQPSTTVAAPATIEAFWVTDLYAKNLGYVIQINNDIGDHVKEGQVMAVLYDPELQAQANIATASLGQARARLGVAKTELVGFEADLALQRVTLERLRALFAGRAATAQTVDEAQAKEDVARATVEKGKANIRLAEADLEAAKAGAERYQTLLGYNKIVAPFDGVVTRRLLSPGDLVQAATSPRTAPLFTCQKIDVVRVFAFVPESSASAIRPGTPAEVKLYDPAGPTIKGAVTRIAKALDPSTRTMRVEIDLPNSDEKLRPGSYARVTFEIAPSGTGADRPLGLIDDGGTRRGTFVPTNGAAPPPGLE